MRVYKNFSVCFVYLYCSGGNGGPPSYSSDFGGGSGGQGDIGKRGRADSDMNMAVEGV